MKVMLLGLSHRYNSGNVMFLFRGNRSLIINRLFNSSKEKFIMGWEN